MEDIYCLKCRKKTKTDNIKIMTSKNNRRMQRGTCSICNTVKNKFIGGNLSDTIIDKMPEFHVPYSFNKKYNYLGPFTKLDKRLDKNLNPLPGNEPINQLDSIAMNHDICYRDTPKFKNKNRICDKKMLNDLKELKPNSIKEWIDKKLTQGVIGSKYYSGLGN